jgi:hypothetical protein
MRLVNSTSYPDYFLRRMVSWCCKEIGYPVRSISQKRFVTRRDGRTSGRAWWPSNRIHISAAGTFADWQKSKRWGWFGERDPEAHEVRRVNSLVHVTAHEIIHLWLHRTEGKSEAQEKKTERHAKRVKEQFLANRDALLKEWSAPPAEKPKQPQPSLQERRAAAAQKKLVEWTRKQKLASTKVKQYRRKVRYYERALAAKRGEERRA